MSTPASLSGAAYLAHRRDVSSPKGSSPSISGTSRGHATETTVDARVERADERLVAAARDGRLGREQADRGGCASRARRRAPRAASTPTTGTESVRWSSGSAAAVAELHAATMSLTPCAFEVAGDLEREAADLVERPRAVRQPRAVAEVDEVLVRQRDEALVQDGEAAHARVEHADRPRDPSRGIVADAATAGPSTLGQALGYPSAP